VKQLSASSVADIKDELARAGYVAVSVAAFDYCWTTPATRSSGNVIMPFPGDVTREGRAICLVNYEDLDGEPELGGGRFIMRNSWDGYWGVNCKFGTGYGTLPYAYLTSYSKEAYAII
jgi:C1A family cysteine protease